MTDALRALGYLKAPTALQSRLRTLCFGTRLTAENLTGHLTQCVGAGMRGWPLGERWRSPKNG
jgi:hypothetical protein